MCRSLPAVCGFVPRNGNVGSSLSLRAARPPSCRPAARPLKTMPIRTLAPEEVDAKVLNASGPVILDFYQATCPPCRALETRLARITQQYPGHSVYRVDIDRNMPVAERFHVQSLPTILVLHHGREVERLDGLITDAQLRSAFEHGARARE